VSRPSCASSAFSGQACPSAGHWQWHRPGSSHPLHQGEFPLDGEPTCGPIGVTRARLRKRLFHRTFKDALVEGFADCPEQAYGKASRRSVRLGKVVEFRGDGVVCGACGPGGRMVETPMLLRLLLCCLTTLLSAPSFANAADESAAVESYLCISDMATGFSFDKERGMWRDVAFTDGRKYLVVRSSENPSKWEVKTNEQPEPSAFCDNGFSSAGLMMCRGAIEFRMNRNSLRFIAAHLFGYWTADIPSPSGEFQEGRFTPYLLIGKCSPL